MTSIRPWWKQPLVWFIIGLPGSMVVIAFALLGVALRHSDSLITAHPYEKGLQIGSVVDKAHHAAVLHLHARLGVSGGGVVVQLTPATGDATLTLQLDHPFDPTHDRHLTLNPIAPGVYSAAVALDPVLYAAQLEGRDWSLSGRWKPGTAGQLDPGVNTSLGDAPPDD